jgi:hypothetical protein
MEDAKIDLVTQAMMMDKDHRTRHPSGLTKAVPRFKEDLDAVLDLATSNQPTMSCVRSKHMLNAYYRFGDASSVGFGSTVECPSKIHGRFGAWGRDKDDKSSNYWKLGNLVEMVEEEASEGHMKDCELWLFMTGQVHGQRLLHRRRVNFMVIAFINSEAKDGGNPTWTCAAYHHRPTYGLG